MRLQFFLVVYCERNLWLRVLQRPFTKQRNNKTVFLAPTWNLFTNNTVVCLLQETFLNDVPKIFKLPRKPAFTINRKFQRRRKFLSQAFHFKFSMFFQNCKTRTLSIVSLNGSLNEFQKSWSWSGRSSACRATRPFYRGTLAPIENGKFPITFINQTFNDSKSSEGCSAPESVDLKLWIRLKDATRIYPRTIFQCWQWTNATLIIHPGLFLHFCLVDVKLFFLWVLRG